jgi:hypothetical protein
MLISSIIVTISKKVLQLFCVINKCDSELKKRYFLLK